MLPNVGTWELIIILLVVFMVFGAKRLPDVARGMGRGMREFRRAIQGITDEINLPQDTPAAGRTAADATPQPSASKDVASNDVASNDDRDASPAGSESPANGSAPTERPSTDP